MYAVVYPASESPKKMGPPEEVDPVGPVEKGLLIKGEEVGEANWLEEGGKVSQERVRRQDCRTMEKDAGARGSCVEV